MVAVTAAILRWGFGFIACVIALLVLSFVIDFFTRRSLDQKISVVDIHGKDSSDVMIVFPGAFSSAEYQFEPVMSQLDFNGRVLYIESSGTKYDYEKLDAKAYSYVLGLLHSSVRRITFVGTSAGAGRAWQLAMSLHESGQLASITTNFVVIDGVGSPEDLAQPGRFGAKYLSRLPFGWLWNHVPVAKFAIQPSDTPPLPEWKEHAREGLAAARNTKTAAWADQLRSMGATTVTPGSLDWVDRVVYIRSLRDTSVVDGDKSIATWQATTSRLEVEAVDANHTDFEAEPLAYASIIQGVLDG